MSVLVKGMEKPEHCGYCRFRYDGICHALQKTQYSMNECPLVVLDDVVPVIRCKDCKYAQITYDGECKYCDIWFPDEAVYIDGDSFCSSAERKED